MIPLTSTKLSVLNFYAVLIHLNFVLKTFSPSSDKYNCKMKIFYDQILVSYDILNFRKFQSFPSLKNHLLIISAGKH